jgi:tRNA-uridine 2-sulfurtransferase
MRAAAHLGIPFMTLDLEREYKDEIVEYMIREYRAGRTPNPDVMCNKYIKFGAFLAKARELGADGVATGHYARVERGADGTYVLRAGVDADKDQSYFLWMLGQEELGSIMFPVGGLNKKTEVRALAEALGLPNAERKDSQGLCFVGKIDMRDFLKRFIPEKRGDVLDESGAVIGWHEGATFYTLGQRHGFTITHKGTDDPPRYVIAKDVEVNTITVSDKEYEKRSAAREVALGDVHFTAGIEPDTERAYHARIRHRQPLQSCILRKAGSGYVAIFDTPQTAVAPGQSLVLYDRDVCIGGGVVERVVSGGVQGAACAHHHGTHEANV